MHYVKKLQNEKATAENRLARVEEELRNLKSYLQSAKFHTDTNVNVQDVLTRIDQNVSPALTEELPTEEEE